MNGLRLTRNLSLVAAVFLAAGQGSGCDDDPTPPDALCTGKTGTYVLTPTAPAPPPAPYTVTDRYFFYRNRDGSDPACKLAVYEDCPDDVDNYFQYDIGEFCPTTVFSARAGAGVAAYDFFGDWIRPYNTGSGPFATGFYERPTGETGTFEFYEEGRTP